MHGKTVLIIGIVTLLLVFCSACTTSSDTPPVPATGSLAVSSSPPGAEIYLDGIARGTTPATISDIPTGSHTLELRLRGYGNWLILVEIAGVTEVSIDAILTPDAVPTATPTTVPTMVPTPTPPTNPIPGCWIMEAEKSGNQFAYVLAFEPGGYGQWSFVSSSEKMSVSTGWSFDPDAAVVYVTYVNPHNMSEVRDLTLDYDAASDTLTDRTIPIIPFVRTSCQENP